MDNTRNLIAAMCMGCVWTATGLMVAVAIAALAFYLYSMNTIRSVGIIRTSDVSKAKQMLKVTNKVDAIRSRSLPNIRLQNMFHIENAFTTFDPEIHDISVRKIRKLIKIDSVQAEKDFIQDIFQTDKNICIEKYKGDIPFKKYLLITVFKFSIRKFFNDDLTDLPEEEISMLCLKSAEEITSLWLKSKDYRQESVPEADIKKPLFDSLQKLFPRLDICNNLENPLNVILPSFETLWRVLYRICVQVKCISRSDEAGKCLDLFNKLKEYPSVEAFENLENGISVNNIIKEMLFLSPPTRTIYRQGEGNAIIGIDVLKLHYQHTGEHPEFHPQRWVKNPKIPFFTFGYSTMQCPAKAMFAPLELGLMAATIFDLFKDYSWRKYNDFLQTFENLDVNDRIKYIEFNLKHE